MVSAGEKSYCDISLHHLMKILIKVIITSSSRNWDTLTLYAVIQEM